MWYSWSEARKLGDESHQQEQRKGINQQQGGIPSSTSYHSTLLDLQVTLGSLAMHLQHPSAKDVRMLWDTFLANVHPVVKVFFDWDVEPLMQKATVDPETLSGGQQSLCFAIYFAALMSLSDEECKEMLNCSTRSSLLDNFQSYIENALMASNYASTSDILVLQALLLYVVFIA